MIPDHVENEIKRLMPSIRNTNKYANIVRTLYQKGAIDRSKAIKTAELENILGGSVGSYLKRMEKKSVLWSVKNGSAKFVLDNAIENENCFLHTTVEIESARKERAANLLKQVQENENLFLICVNILDLKEGATLGVIRELISYSNRKEIEKQHLENYNKIVRKLKEEGIPLKNYDELNWRRGSYSWYLNKQFIDSTNIL